ncbi:MAG TPA: N-acetylmuramoyl-L-alanine amidase-like domain-containing protein, partial [Oculatellaceae cyanobacterium]
MRKRFKLAVVGVAIAGGVASHFASQARENPPRPLTSTLADTLAEQQRLAKHSLGRVTALPRKDVLDQDNRIDQSPAIHFEGSDSSVVRNKRSLDGLDAQTPKQEIPKAEDGKTFRRIMQYVNTKKLYQRPMGEIVQAIAQQFLGTAYKANLLDQSKEETLVITLNKFDCVLFVETVLALARGVAVQDYSSETFVNHIRDQRYRNGQIDGYCSRLHYFSDWIWDNEKRGAVQNIVQELGGVPLNKKFNFMTTHRQSYRPLANNDANYQCMVEMENKLNQVTFDYIPTNQIRRLYNRLQPGDIVAIATNLPGLDVTHTGLVYRTREGNIGFIHASPIGEVTIASD